MNIKLFSVCLYNLIQIISAQVLRQDVASLDILNNLQYIPLADLIRSKRQFNNPPVNLNKNANLPNGLGNGMPFGNVLPKNINNNGIINGRTLPFNLPFSNNINIGPQNRILPNINGINNNAFTINNLPASNNVIENLNNLPNPGNILPNNNPLPNILPNINQVPNVLPSFEKEPCNVLPSLCNNGLPQSNLPFSNVLPSTNLPNSNILPSNNNLPNINLMPTNSLPNVLPQNNLPNGNVMPINNLPYNDVLPSNNLPINTLLPNLENFRITGFQFADGVTNFNGIPQNNLPIGNLNNNVNKMPAFNIIPDTVQRIPEELSPINNCQNHNGNTGSNSVPINLPFNDGFSSCNLPIGNIPSPITSEPQYINYYAKGNGMPDARNVIGNPMPVTNHQLNGIPFNNGIPLANNPLIGTTVMPVNPLPPSNNIILIDPIEAYLQNVISSGILNNNHNQCTTPQVPVNNFQYEYLNSNMPVIPNFPENDCQADFVFNNLNLAQEIVKSLKIEGLENLPFLNGLPVAGITETVTVLNSPCM
ncbi:putative uncharacterized protein DDB_G0286901 [Spodoptera frugiperda]|uniref:Uncharacterized protein n=1 Tax=Spodoptera frugiperda TaxID=7108 RepID=A0A9R0E3Q7_SPOFR|nr:putative uncharacterized protein DDB_G0286901 [Spodoptera frugiperda]